MGAIFTFKDSGVDLNQALSSASQLLPLEQPIIIIMPDLPFISKEFIVSLLKEISKYDNDVIIVPSISDDNTKGTAILYLKNPNSLSFRFGKNSSQKFLSNADQNGLTCHVISFEPFARDIDTLDDIKYLKQHLTMIREPKQFVHLLGKIS